MFKPEGIYVAMLTSFTGDGRINEKEMRRMVDFQIDRGVDGLFPVSSVGESIHMSREQKVVLMEIVHDQSRGRVPVTPGVGSSHPAESVFLAKRAKEIGCDGIVIAPPYFYPLSQNMIGKYYETIIDAVEIPVIIYNIPLFAQPLGYNLVKHLALRPNVVGMKDSSGSMVDFLHFMDTVRPVKENMNFLTGREEIFLPCLMMGGMGCMTGTSGILPEVMVKIYEAFLKGDYETARKEQFSILSAVRSMFALPFPLGFKIAMEMRGIEMGPPKQPLSNAELSEYETMKDRINKDLDPIINHIKEGTAV
ncbi:MAG: dihydrodipicolinate synthase family protein [Deltaproteobacteria bacterium]|nr:dihydrodipicolinate synthase family protein [Deltaproteobacteria bacterium]